jgi:hypothetical protein
MSYGYIFAAFSNMFRIVLQNFESDDEREIRVERNAVRNFTTSDTIVIIHHNFMDLIHPVSTPFISNNSWVTVVRNFP